MTFRPATALTGGSEGTGSLNQNFTFYVGLHQPSDAKHFERCMVSVARLRDRKGDFAVGEWIMDSGAFMELKLHGAYRDEPAVYAAQIKRWSRCGRLAAAVSQDYMCEPFMLARTGLTITDHQRLTISRYDTLAGLRPGVYVMPVLQGWKPQDYAEHVRQYGRRLRKGMWVGVGSVCKRNGNPSKIRDVLAAIQCVRPDLRLHGFGIKQTALYWRGGLIRSMLHSADSMAWSYAARREGRDANDWQEGDAYRQRLHDAFENPTLEAA